MQMPCSGNGQGPNGYCQLLFEDLFSVQRSNNSSCNYVPTLILGESVKESSTSYPESNSMYSSSLCSSVGVMPLSQP